MSYSVNKWIRDYFVDIGTVHGGMFTNIPAMKIKKKCQIIQFLTHDITPEVDYIWAVISDRKYRIPVKFTTTALREYERDPRSKDKRFTECKGALVSVTEFTPCFRRVAIQEGRRMSSECMLSLDINLVQVIGCHSESIWGSPVSLEKDHDLGEWMTELRKQNGNVNLFKGRKETDKLVQKEIEKFNSFAAKVASPPSKASRVIPHTPQRREQEEIKPNIARREPTLAELYNKKWKKLLGSARDSFEQACIPQEVKLHVIGAQTTRNIQPPRFKNRDPLNLDSSQEMRRSISPPHTPRQTTPEQDEWPASQIDESDVLEDTAPGDLGSDSGSERSSSRGSTPIEDSELDHEDSILEKRDSTPEMKTLDTIITTTLHLSPPPAAQRTRSPSRGSTPARTRNLDELPSSTLPIPNEIELQNLLSSSQDPVPAEPRRSSSVGLLNDRPSTDVVKSVSTLSQSDHFDPDVAFCLSARTQEESNPTSNSISHQINPSLPDSSLPRQDHHDPNLAFYLSAPASEQQSNPMSTLFSHQVNPSLPDSSLPLPSTLNRTLNESETRLSPRGPNHYVQEVNRKVPIPRHGPPVRVQYDPLDEKAFTVLVPASDGSGAASQLQLVSQSQVLVPPSDGSGTTSQLQQVSQPRVLVPASDESGTASQLRLVSQPELPGSSAQAPALGIEMGEKQSSMPPIEFIPEQAAESSSHGSDEEEKDELDAHDPSGHDDTDTNDKVPDPDDVIIANKLKGTFVTPRRALVKSALEKTSPPIPNLLAQMAPVLEVRGQTKNDSRQRSPSPSVKRISAQRREFTPPFHDPVAWRDPSFKLKNKGKGKETVHDIENPVGRKRTPSASLSEDEHFQARRRQKLYHDRKSTHSMADMRKLSFVAPAPRRPMKDPDNRRNSAHTSSISRAKSTSTSRGSSSSRRNEVSSRTDIHPKEKLGGLEVSFDILPIDGVSLLTQGSVRDILLRTGQARHKEAKARKKSEPNKYGPRMC